MFPTHLRVGAIPVLHMLLREPSRHRIRVPGEQMAVPARRTMVGHQDILDARDERSLGTRGAEQHVRLKRHHDAIGLVAQDQDRTGNAGDPEGAVSRARLFVAISSGSAAVTCVSTPPSQRILIGRISAALPALSVVSEASASAL